MYSSRQTIHQCYYNIAYANFIDDYHEEVDGWGQHIVRNRKEPKTAFSDLMPGYAHFFLFILFSIGFLVDRWTVVFASYLYVVSCQLILTNGAFFICDYLYKSGGSQHLL